VEGLSKPFEPEAYPNETRHALLEFLEAKAAGQEIEPVEEAPAPAPVVDLMAALKASLAAAGSGEGEEEGEEEPEEEPAPKAKRAAAKAAEGDDDDQLSIEQGRLRKVEGGGEGGKASGRAKKAPQRRRKAS